MWKLSELQIDFHPFRIAKIARDLILIEFFRAGRIDDDDGSKSSSCTMLCVYVVMCSVRVRVYAQHT